MKKDNRINPVGLKGNQINERMKELMGIAPINENKSTSVVELTKMGPDGKAYAIVRENHSYFIKISDKKENLVKEDFKFIGGYMNRVAYPSYEKAIKHLNLKFNSLSESLDSGHNINVFENDNLIKEAGIAGFSSYNGNGFSGEGNLEGNNTLPVEENKTENKYVDEELTEVEAAVEGMISENEEFAGYSNCCDAKVYGETDICPKCKEHCEVVKDEKKESVNETHKLSVARALEKMDAIIDTLSEGKVKKKVYTLK